MGRAIVREPQAFLMDEPLSNLDAKLRVQMRTEISKIQRDLGVTTMYVTHDQTEAMTMGDQVAVMRGGLVQQIDRPQSIYARPVNLFVAGFIGSPSMNMVRARLERDNGSLYAHFGSNRLLVDEEALAIRPTLPDYDNRDVVLGIRPEDMEDAAFETGIPDDRRIQADVDLTEAMGPEMLVHTRGDAPPVVTEQTKELAADAGEEALESLVGEEQQNRTTMIARVNPRTTAEDGGRIELAVDTRTLHFFDIDTGQGIY